MAEVSQEVEVEAERVSICIRRRPSSYKKPDDFVDDEGAGQSHVVLGVEAAFTLQVTCAQIKEQGQEQKLQESLNEMGLSWLTPTARERMLPHEIEELIQG